MRIIAAMMILIMMTSTLAGCTGADEEFTDCEEAETTLTQYGTYQCEFSGGTRAEATTLSIEMTSTGDSPVHIFTFDSDQYDSWSMCEDFEANDFFSEEFSTGASMEGEIDYDDFYVIFDHPNSCDEEDASTPIVEFSFKVIVS